MTCTAAQKLLVLYLQGDLPDRKKGKVEIHLSQCPSCREFVREFSSYQAAVKAYAAGVIEPSDREALRRAVLANIPSDGSTSPARWQGFGFLVQGRIVTAGGALLALLIVGGMLIALRHQGTMRHRAASSAERTGSAKLEITEPPSTQAVAHPGAVKRRKEALHRRAPTRSAPSLHEMNPLPDLKASEATPVDQPSTMPSNTGSNAEGPPVNQIVVRLLSDDPRVVIYWILETRGGNP